MNYLGRHVLNMPLENSGNNSRKSEGMEPNNNNNTLLWMGLVIEARFNAVKSNIA